MKPNFEGYVRRRLLGLSSKRGFPLIDAVIDILYGDLRKSLEMRKCGFCGREFRSKNAAMLHVGHVHWGELERAVLEVLRVYESLKSRVRKTRRMRNRRRVNCVILDAEGRRYRFRSFSELAEFLKSNPHLISGGVDG